MVNLIRVTFTEQITIILQWIKLYQTGELKSIEVFSKKDQWFEEGFMSTGSPQRRGVRDPNEQENNHRKYHTL